VAKAGSLNEGQQAIGNWQIAPTLCNGDRCQRARCHVQGIIGSEATTH